ncbi:hypothetical protein ES332_D08G068900v1 [Gossypium tomentosum]|uniref:CCHC-type domain-containing protein n=1 Tax=Gossypium tomentosum TaxID=34277 RepID=A0A5D2JQP8_GOSTO|nr:hypothetical protein ES332_D08G068900v1 [Gossypium tomentosum]
MRLQCQICGEFGHLAQRCFYRYDSTSDGEGENPRMRADNENSNWVESASHVGLKLITTYMCYTGSGSTCSGLQSHHYVPDPVVRGPLRQIQPSAYEVDQVHHGSSQQFQFPFAFD